MDTTAIFGWTSTRTINAPGIFLAFFPEKNSFKQDFMLPVITKIVHVVCSDSDIGKIVRNGDFPTRMNLRDTLKYEIVRDANFRCVAGVFPADDKEVQVVVQPTHGILNRYMQIPKAVVFRYLNAPPDGRDNSLK